MTFTAKARSLLDELGAGPVFVHSDPFRAARLVKPVRDRSTLLDSHIALMKDVARDRGLWMPAFNYDFPGTRVFKVASDEAEVGPIPERFRLAHAEWRTPIPLFSVSGFGTAQMVSWGDNTDPFGEDSIFSRLVASDGVVLYYGETFAYNTILHYAERSSGGPSYRYDKLFHGSVVKFDGFSIPGSLCYHVRPLGRDLDYDWTGMLQSALDSAVCRRVEGHPEVLASSARALCDFWIAAMRADPLALLDAKSRAWVEPMLQKLGRRFSIGDFEESAIIRPTHD